MTLKVELHAHTADDPVDRIPYTTEELIDRVAGAGYDALAVTLHDRQLDIGPLAEFAAARRVVLIPGIERTIEGRHVLLLNFQSGAEDVHTFADLARLKAGAPGLVIAPHPFFPAGSSLGHHLDEHAALFDAVERNAMYTSTLDFNLRAERWAARHGKPVVGGGDIHRLYQIGATWSLVDAEPDAGAICRAIAAGQVRVESHPLTWLRAVRTMASMVLTPPRVLRHGRQPKSDGLWGVKESADAQGS